jgi:hypothetical protein
LTVDRARAYQHRAEDNGRFWKKDEETGKMQYRTAGGLWVDRSDVDEAYSRWGGDQFTQQWALGHEMEKATTQEEQDFLKTSVGGLMTDSWGLGATQQKGVWKGAAFNKQNLNRQWKHYSPDGKGGMKQSAVKMMQEIDEKQGNYQMMQQSSDTWRSMSHAMIDAGGVLNDYGSTDAERAEAQEIIDRGKRIAFSTRSSAMADTPGEDGQAPVQRGSAGRPVGAGAAGAVQEEMSNFVQISDRYGGAYTPPTNIPSAEIGPRRPGDAPRTTDSLAERGRNGREG